MLPNFWRLPHMSAWDELKLLDNNKDGLINSQDINLTI